MNLREQILKEHSKRNTAKITKYVGEDPERFKALMRLFFNDEYRVVQRAAWAVGNIGVDHKYLVKPYLKKMTDYLQKPPHDAVKRNVLRIFQFIEIPKNLQGRLVDICFKFLLSKDEPIAIKVFSMTVLANISKKNPDLKNEIKMVIEEMLPFAGPGIRARGKRTLKELNT
ncbi:MAG: hypothetical protein IAF38_00150 [Bacteroidia bacterium]|nr:hypothetical protein [Bacteroidia bacterium]